MRPRIDLYHKLGGPARGVSCCLRGSWCTSCISGGGGNAAEDTENKD